MRIIRKASAEQARKRAEMPRRTARTRRRGGLALVALLAGAAVAYGALLDGVPKIPVPNPVVSVTTESGGVKKDTTLLIGGPPVAIDVDGTDGTPDIDVSVGLVALDELPDRVVVPNVVVKRHASAIAKRAAAPPLKINVHMHLIGAKAYTIDYGFETPARASVPPLVSAKLIGPITSAFVDPLVARVETPGYEGPLQFNVHVNEEDSFDGTFTAKFDPVPQDFTFTEDPTDDGMDLLYTNHGRALDVKLDTTADIKRLTTGRKQHIGVGVERLPEDLILKHTSTKDGTVLDYSATTSQPKPDVDAVYNETLPSGAVASDVSVKLSGLPSRAVGTISKFETDAGASEITGVRVMVPDGGEIDAMDFVARNWTGVSPVPLHKLGPDNFLTMVSRKQPDGSSRYRMAGRLTKVRDAGYLRSGAEHDNLDIVAKVGNGAKTMRAILDLDDRDIPAKKGQKRHFVDSTIAPLPTELTVHYAPATKKTATRLDYTSKGAVRPVQVATRTVIAEGVGDDCGADRVDCAVASVHPLPPAINIALPGKGGTDFSVDHNGATKPELRGTVDVGPDSTDNPPSPRRWLRTTLTGVPQHVRGRMDTTTGELRAAEFHGCTYDFADDTCKTGTEGEIDHVTFLVRDQPSRTGLPPRPAVGRQHVTLVSREKDKQPKRFEVAGEVDAVRHVAFRQLDRTKNDGETDGVLGALVDVGTGGDEFDVVLDEIGVARDEDAPRIPEEPAPVIGEDKTQVGVHVDPLPPRFSTCVRKTKDEEFDTSDLPADKLLDRCLKTDVVEPREGEKEVTPLTAHYEAYELDGTTPATPDVSARVVTTKPDKEDPNPDDEDDAKEWIPNTTRLDLGVVEMPGQLDLNVIPPITPEPKANPPVAGRRLQALYDTQGGVIPLMKVELEQRRAASVCEDPRPRQKALCLSATLKNVPSFVRTEYDPDEASGEIDVKSAPPADPARKLEILPLHLSRVAPEKDSKPIAVDATIVGITPHMTGHIQSLELDGEAKSGNLPLAQQLATCSNADADGDPIDDDGDGKANESDSDCETDPARLEFDACPPDVSNCQGIDFMSFEATDQIVPDPQPEAPGGCGYTSCTPPAPPDPDPDPRQEFSFIQEGEFHATGKVRKFKKLRYAKVGDDGLPSRVTRASMGLGGGEPLDVTIDRNTGAKRELLRGTVYEGPETIDLCMRDPVPVADLTAGSNDVCQTADPHPDLGTVHDKLAMQVKLEPGASSLPDIDINRFEFSKGGGAEVLAGSLRIDNLAERIDILQGKGDDTELALEGHPYDAPARGGALTKVAGRTTFSVRNFRDVAGLTDYPWTPLDEGVTAPKDDDRNGPPGARNFLQLVKSHDSLLAEGSVPGVKRVQVTPRPCEAERNRTPSLQEPWGSSKPEYKCVKTDMEAGLPLGLAVRTLKGGQSALEALSLEEGRISQMPAQLEATISKSPDQHELRPRCSDQDPDPEKPFVVCRPTLLSIERSDSAFEPVFEARLAKGRTNDLDVLHDKDPDDVLSSRIGFEQSPSEWGDHPAEPDAAKAEPDAGQPITGARVKLGSNSETGESALRMTARLRLPRFLDLDPVTHFSCTTLIEEPVNPATDCGGDQERQVGSELNQGFESRDVLVRLVGADDRHFGNPLPTRRFLGRVALMVEPLGSEAPPTQIVLGGMPKPDGKDPIRRQPITGAGSYSPENLPAAGHPSDKGFLAPSHLDAAVYLRNDYRASDGVRNQVKFSQVDGRVNAPLSMALRQNERPPVDAAALKKYRPSANRAMTRVASTQVLIRNAPGSNNTGSYENPTFRVRAETRKGFQKAPKDFEDWLKDAFMCGGFDGPVCVVLPDQSITRYLDVQLNADPLSDGITTTDAAARTVDAVGGPFGSTNDAEIRGFREIRGRGDKGPRAVVTNTTTMRRTGFNLGFKINPELFGFGVLLSYEMLGDLIFGMAGDRVERSRLSHNKLQFRVRSEGGSTRLMTDLRARNRLRAVLRARWFNITLINSATPEFPQAIQFNKCAGSGGDFDMNRVTVGPGEEAKGSIQLRFGDIFSVSNSVLQALSDFLAPFGCIDDLPKIDFKTSSSPMVGLDNANLAAGSPAPTYSVPGHGVPGVDPTVPDATRQPPPLDGGDPLEDKIIKPGAGEVMCGEHRFKTLTVQSHALLTVAAPGTVIGGVECDGTLAIEADKIIVEQDGAIDAAAIVSGGPGKPDSGAGGGAGHQHPGGASGAEKVTVGAGPGGPEYTAAPEAGFAGESGSEGRAGTDGSTAIAPGRGGGAIKIEAEVIVNQGKITAAGGKGHDAPSGGGACGTGGGGGSGGTVRVITDLVAGTGDISARGGDGGDGAYGGGGGSPGTVRIDAVASDKVADDTAEEKRKAGDESGGAGGGTDNGFCQGPVRNEPRHAGDDSQSGTTSFRGPALASWAELHEESEIYTRRSPPVTVNVVSRVSGTAGEVIMCKKHARYDAPDALGAATDPPPNRMTFEELEAEPPSRCTDPMVVDFSTGHFDAVEHPSFAGTGVWGFYTFARILRCDPGFEYGVPEDENGEPIGDDPTCWKHNEQQGKPPVIRAPDLVSQDDWPTTSLAKIGVDLEDPEITDPSVAADKTTCPRENGFDAICLTSAEAQVSIGANDNIGNGDVPGSGIAKVECEVTEYVQPSLPWTGCDAAPTTLALPEGPSTIRARAFDRSGRSVPHTAGEKLVRAFVDTRAPTAPSITLDYPAGSQTHNGWHSAFPKVIVQGAEDPGPSSGFVAAVPGFKVPTDEAITLYVEEGKRKCSGLASSGTLFEHEKATAECEHVLKSVADDPVDGLDPGRYRLTATASDHIGHTSGVSEGVDIKVDTKPPVSRITVGPKHPDGENGWYRAKPFLAFSSVDGPNGSGVRPEEDETGAGTGIWIRIDEESEFHRYDPNQPIVLDDGEHEACWYAIDLAGNVEDADPATPNTKGKDDPHCKQHIFVDTAPPVAAAEISPDDPDGSHDFYVTRPEVTVSAEDPDPGSEPHSGLDRVEYRVDDGPWKLGAPFLVEEGEHLIAVRAFDKAGNAAELEERTLRVDLTEPVTDTTSYPPSPNAQGWLRQPRFHSVLAEDPLGGSGIDSATYAVDGGGDAPFDAPFAVEDGEHEVTARSVDRAGNRSTSSAAIGSKIDLVRPSGAPMNTPSPVERTLLGDSVTSTTLKFTGNDNVSSRIRVVLFVLDTAGNAVRRLVVPGSSPDGYRATGDGSIGWDGRDERGKPAPLGTYYFRVQVTDQAGNTATSTESPVFAVKLKLL